MFLIPCNDFGNFPKIYFENTITIAAAKNAPKIPPINPDPVPKNLSGSATPELAIAFLKIHMIHLMYRSILLQPQI
ncbi:hypothetical protein ONA00_01920 [Mycoplasmopsis cynos]|nr:hypothetical protein [Mycoplasmopsis cynos]WAM11228.1 hypothetical protein ONA00_01920 [Mycoplasmopsis cynos]